MTSNVLDPRRFEALTARFSGLRIAVLGDFCLDRYLEIDPTRTEVSIETGLPVHNVVRVRAQPGAAGTILNNLVALGVGTLHPIGFCGVDGEGFELRRALGAMPGVKLETFLETPDRRTFTYCKPLVLEQDQAPRELNRLDTKNWSPTPASVERQIIRNLESIESKIDGMVILDQVDHAGTGVATDAVLAAVARASQRHSSIWILADSRRGLGGFPSVCFKMNRVELAKLMETPGEPPLEQVAVLASTLARRQQRHVFVTLSEAGMLGASPQGEVVQVPTWPVRGAIDIVGAGDAVMANLTVALAAGATLREALQLGNTAASVVVHQLGTTGTASVDQIRALMFATAGA